MFFSGGRNRRNPQRPVRSANRENADLIPISASLHDNIAFFRRKLDDPGDLVIREIKIGADQLSGAIICIDGLIEKNLINEQVLKPLLFHFADRPSGAYSSIIGVLKEEVLTAFDVSHVDTMDVAMESALSGETVLFLEGIPTAIIVSSRGWKSRGIQEPETESLIRGPRIGFSEDLRTNTALLRRRIRDYNLRLTPYTLGRRSKTEVVVAYIDGIVHPEVVTEVTRRLKSIDIDDVDSSGTVEHWIADSVMSPFPLISNTERPDKVAGALYQGRVGVFVDGDPFALIMPITFSSNIQSPEDFYQNWMVSTLTRILRMIAAFMATFLPALYIALLEFHHGMIPSQLAFSIAGAREGVPFPAVIEAFIMETTLELLREAGVRLPKQIGQTIGIVGGLVIGEAAVAAGVVSPIMVIVVAITAIASFSFPSYSFAVSLRMVRFGVMLAASLLGLYGIILAYIMINIHFVNLKSFGIPYSAPFAPLFLRDWKDLIVRAPITQLDKRPEMLVTENPRRINEE